MLKLQQLQGVKGFPLIKLAKKLKVDPNGKVWPIKAFPLIKLAKKLKVDTLVELLDRIAESFPLIKLAKKLKGGSSPSWLPL